MICSQFLPEYFEQVDVPIVTGATAVDLKHGSTEILIFGQGIQFIDRMDRTLIKPNQCSNYGIPVCDYLTDNHTEIGIEIDDDLSMLKYHFCA